MTTTAARERRRRPLWQWVLIGLFSFVLAVTLLVVAFFRFTPSGRQIVNLAVGTVELLRLSRTPGEGEAKTALGQWQLRLLKGLKWNGAALDAGVQELQRSGFLSKESITDAGARAKAIKGIDRYASLVRSIRSANVAIEGTALDELATLPIPASARERLREVWHPPIHDLLLTMDEKLAADEEFVMAVRALYTFLDGTKPLLTEGQLQFKSQADLDMYTHISTMIEQLRAASQAADERYAQKVDALPQAIEQATMEALRR